MRFSIWTSFLCQDEFEFKKLQVHLFVYIIYIMVRARLQWSAQEETAMRAGITKHGVGNWRRILDDPEFSAALFMRTNVDLKDKYRNMNLRKGESRNGYKPVKKNIKKRSSRCNQSGDLTIEASGKNKIAQPEPLAITYKSSEDEGSDKITSSSRGLTTAALPNTGAENNATKTPGNETSRLVPALITYTRRGKGRTANTTIDGRN